MVKYHTGTCASTHTHAHTPTNGIPGDLLPCQQCSPSSPSLNLLFFQRPHLQSSCGGKILSVSLTHFSVTSSPLLPTASLSLPLSPRFPPVNCSVTRAACAVLCQWILTFSVTLFSSAAPLLLAEKSTDCSILPLLHKHTQAHTHTDEVGGTTALLFPQNVWQ